MPWYIPLIPALGQQKQRMSVSLTPVSFQDSERYIERPSLKNKTTPPKKNLTMRFLSYTSQMIKNSKINSAHAGKDVDKGELILAGERQICIFTTEICVVVP